VLKKLAAAARMARRHVYPRAGFAEASAGTNNPAGSVSGALLVILFILLLAAAISVVTARDGRDCVTEKSPPASAGQDLCILPSV
jgi:hypothetical protein